MYSVLVVLCSVYSAVALGYPTSAGQVPAVVATLVGVISVFELFRALRTRSPRRHSEVGRGANEIVCSSSSTYITPVEMSSEKLSDGQPSPIQVLTDSGQSLIQSAYRSGPSDLTDRIAKSHQSFREIVAFGWVVLFVGSFYILGVNWGIPVAAGIYCVAGNRLSNVKQTVVFSVITTITAFILSYGFLQVFHLPSGGIL